MVINIECTVAAIKKAVEEAELMAGCEISHWFSLGIAGGHIKGFNSHGIVAVKNKEVSQRDVDRVIDAAKAVAIPMDREVIHMLPQEYIIDDQDGIKEPLGMSGVRLEARVHIVTGGRDLGAEHRQVLQPRRSQRRRHRAPAAGDRRSGAHREERELGVALVDMGGGTTDIAIFHDGAVVHTAVMPIGGNHVTTDIAAGLRTPFADAETHQAALWFRQDVDGLGRRTRRGAERRR